MFTRAGRRRKIYMLCIRRGGNGRDAMPARSYDPAACIVLVRPYTAAPRQPFPSLGATESGSVSLIGAGSAAMDGHNLPAPAWRILELWGRLLARFKGPVMQQGLPFRGQGPNGIARPTPFIRL